MTTEATERDLVTEVETFLTKRATVNRYVRSVCCNYAPCESCNQDWCGCECHDPSERDFLELLRRLVEEVKEHRETLAALNNCRNKPVCGHCNALLRTALRVSP